MKPTIRIGTRGSALALAQANWLRQTLLAISDGAPVELVTIKTSGDRFVDRPLRTLGGKGLFVKEIEEALLAGSIDCAIHSLKDLPAEIPPGLELAAVPPREDARDVLISVDARSLRDLPPGSRIGTCSLRRMALLKAMRPDVEIIELRGNVDTRLRRLQQGDFDAIVLAAAGLRRLGLSPAGAVAFDANEFLPAIGQGALAIETRADGDCKRIVASLDDPATRTAITAERAFLAAVGGSCHTPIAAHANLVPSAAATSVEMAALIARPDGTQIVAGIDRRAEAQADDLGRALATRLLSQGGAEIIADVLNGGEGTA